MNRMYSIEFNAQEFVHKLIYHVIKVSTHLMSLEKLAKTTLLLDLLHVVYTIWKQDFY